MPDRTPNVLFASTRKAPNLKLLVTSWRTTPILEKFALLIPTQLFQVMDLDAISSEDHVIDDAQRFLMEHLGVFGRRLDLAQ